MEQVKIRERAFAFSVRIIRLLSHRSSTHQLTPLYRELIRSATSIGANIVEGQSSATRKEFLHYLQISYRSSKETEYWLNLLFRSGGLSERELQPLIDENKNISNILTAILIKGKQQRT